MPEDEGRTGATVWQKIVAVNKPKSALTEQNVIGGRGNCGKSRPWHPMVLDRVPVCQIAPELIDRLRTASRADQAVARNEDRQTAGPALEWTPQSRADSCGRPRASVRGAALCSSKSKSLTQSAKPWVVFRQERDDDGSSGPKSARLPACWLSGGVCSCNDLLRDDSLSRDPQFPPVNDSADFCGLSVVRQAGTSMPSERATPRSNRGGLALAS